MREAIANQVEAKIAREREALIVLDGRGWNVLVNGVPVFVSPVDHHFALSLADAVNVREVQR